jgi:hypothetical protein
MGRVGGRSSLSGGSGFIGQDVVRGVEEEVQNIPPILASNIDLLLPWLTQWAPFGLFLAWKNPLATLPQIRSTSSVALPLLDLRYFCGFSR